MDIAELQPQVCLVLPGEGTQLLGDGMSIPVPVVGMVWFVILFNLLELFSLALQTNEKGQVVTKTALLKQMEELIEEPGLTCCICREGYKFQVVGAKSSG